MALYLRLYCFIYSLPELSLKVSSAKAAFPQIFMGLASSYYAGLSLRVTFLWKPSLAALFKVAPKPCYSLSPQPLFTFFMAFINI